MALRHVSLVAILAFCIVLASNAVQAEEEHLQVVNGVNNRRLMATIDCDGLCKVRCSKNSRPNLCLRACGTCCYRCQCVPPGTFGNREMCGSCYVNMTTHDKQPKCP